MGSEKSKKVSKNIKHLLISTPKCIELNYKCIELNSKSILVHPKPRSNAFFLGGMSVCYWET